MTRNSHLSFDDLVAMSGYTQPCEVCAWLDRNGVGYVLGKHNRPSTTVDEFTAALHPETLRQGDKKRTVEV